MNDFIPYGRQWINKDDIKAVVSVLKSEFLTQGPAINTFEKAICDYTGARYCVAVANGTAALHIAVAALGIKAGEEGITSPNSFVASANCLVYNRLKPIFSDIDNKTYNIDPSEIRKKLSKKTKVIIPVHFAGQPAEMERIAIIAKENHLYVIEDAAHAIGSRYADGNAVGNCRYSDMTTFSFHPVKTITTGEGGAITTNNRKLYERLLSLRTHGIIKDKEKLHQNPGPWYYEMQSLGFNYRMTDIQAALGTSQLKKLDKYVKRRREIVKKYNKAFENIDYLKIPFEEEDNYSAFHLYVLLIDFKAINKTRKMVMEELKKNNIGTQVHYIPIHTQPYYKKNFRYKRGDFPEAEDYYNMTLSIPIYPALTDSDISYVINSIINIKK
jgi:UDP-4-amino-4,6-dideoxy-N-acetyl-beta-L-altrosamine transaminase